MRSPPPTFQAPAVASAMRIFDHLARSPDASLSAIAAALSLNKSTCFNILSALAAFGAVAKTPTARYRLGPKLIELGASARRSLSHRHSLRERLRAFVEDIGVGAVIAQTVDELRIVVVDRIIGPPGSEVVPPVGQAYDLTAPALGRAALSCLDPEEAMDVVRRLGGREGEAGRRQLDQIRAEGFATSREQYRAGLNAVAAAVPRLGDPLTVIGLVGRTKELPAGKLNAVGRRLAAFARDLENTIAVGGPIDADNLRARPPARDSRARSQPRPRRAVLHDDPR